jgi:hypothetical protein
MKIKSKFFASVKRLEVFQLQINPRAVAVNNFTSFKGTRENGNPRADPVTS